LVVAVGNPAVSLEQVDHREIGCGLAIGNAVRTKHEPPVDVRGVRKLPDKTRLAHSGLPYDAHELAVPTPRRGQATPQGLDLVVTPHELGHRAPEPQIP